MVSESTVHTLAFSGLPKTSSESYTLAVQRLPDLEGMSRVNDFLSATGAKDFRTSDVVPAPFLALYQIAVLMITRPWKKVSLLAISVGIFFYLSLSACHGGSASARQLHRFAYPWVRHDGTLSQIAR